MLKQDRQPYINTRLDDPFRFFGAPTVLRSTGETTGGHFCLLEHTLAPGFESPWHVHRNEDEAFYVIEGTVAFLCDEAWHVAGPGTWVYGPRDIPHGFRVVGSTPARMLLQCAPAGFEGFVRELSQPIDAEPVPPDVESLGPVAAKYGIEILGPLPRTPARDGMFGDAIESLAGAAERVRRLHVAAVNGGDAEAAAALFAPDGVMLPPDRPALEGRDAIRAWFTGLFDTIRVDGFGIQPTDVQTHGAGLVEHGTWSATFHAGTEPPLPVDGTYVTLFGRTADGRVCMTKDIFTGLPAASAIETTDRERAASVIVDLHRFFADWISGACAKQPELLADALVRRLAPDFAGIMANGAVVTPAALEGWMDAVHGRSPAFRIDIRNVTVRYRIGPVLVVTYEEWQHDAPESPRNSGRISTMVLREHGDHLQIVHLQETMMPDEVVQGGDFDF